MSHQVSAPPSSGLNSAVDYGGKSYHVQTQFSTRDAPVIESLVFNSGQTLVRITSSYAEIAEKLGFTGEDGQHLLEHQHADLIRKIRHGMLGSGDEAQASAAEEDGPPRLIDQSGAVVDLNDVDEPAVKQLLADLGVAIDAAVPEIEVAEPPARPIERPQRSRWPRFAICIRWRR